MKNETNSVVVQIAGKSYSIKCPENANASLQECARLVDGKIRAQKDKTKATSIERIVVLTSLNLTYDFLIAQQEKDRQLEAMQNRIQELQQKIEYALSSTA